jgi:DNA-binding IclR family transcriptional regulator
VLGKITEILNAFTLRQPSLTLRDIQRITGIPASTVQRLVTNLVANGFLDRADDRFRIGVKMAYWAAAAARELDVLDVVNPILKDLRDLTEETACFFGRRASTACASRSPRPGPRCAGRSRWGGSCRSPSAPLGGSCGRGSPSSPSGRCHTSCRS